MCIRDSFNAVDGVSLSLREGSIHALIGPNGAGKTTCFNLLTKFLTPDQGAIHYRGRDITSLAPEQIARLGIVRSFQISAVFLGLTVLQNMRVALMRQHGDGLRFWRSRRSVDRLNDQGLALLEAVGLAGMADTTAAVSYTHLWACACWPGCWRFPIASALGAASAPRRVTTSCSSAAGSACSKAVIRTPKKI